MSRTKKDAPYDVRARANGRIEHDHTAGRCVIGMRSEVYAGWRIQRAHRAICPRNVYLALCIHDGTRANLQHNVDHARAAQKSCYPHHPDAWGSDGVNPQQVSRTLSSMSITEMLLAGYIPNCAQDKTHEIDIRELDLQLLPGERVGDTTLYGRTGIGYVMSRIAILRPGYDEDVECEVCDSKPGITCYISVVTDHYRRSRYYCSCCTDDVDARYPSRTASREETTAYIKEYNTFGVIEY